MITGANGFVGSRLCRMFLSKGFTVRAGVRKSSDLSLLKGLDLEFAYGDVSDPESIPDMVKGVDFIIHNAGIVKAKKKQTFFDINETGTDNLMWAIVKHNPDVTRVVQISSLAGHGPVRDKLPISESSQPRPVTTYGLSKLAGEKKALSYAGRVNVVALRASGVYGPGDKEVFSFFEMLHKKIKPYLGDISRKIQMVHVDDLCRAVYLAATKAPRSGEVYNIAESEAYTFKEMVDIMETASGKKGLTLRIPAFIFRFIAFISEFAFKLVGATPMLTREKSSELLTSWEINIEKAYKDFGFKSEIPFLQGAQETFNWYREQGWLK